MRARFALAFMMSICSAAAAHAGIDGSVFMLPIEQGGGFSSYGEAVYVNALNKVEESVSLSGTHSVHGPEIFTHQVTGRGKYQYELQGPARPGACYGTTLEVNAHPSGSFADSATFTGDTQCAPERSCPDANGNGVCDNHETIDKDPNQDSCPGGSPCSSPLVLNLENGRYRLSGPDDAVAFDIDADRALNRITWTARGSAMAFLACDRNGNASIDDGSELFGNWTVLRSGAHAANGFEALKEFDSNQDGIVDASDRHWSALLLWTDSDHDGVSQPGELQTLDGSLVRGIETTYHWTARRDPSGNFLGYQGLAHLGGTRRPIYDVYFRTVP